jgi:hypothetical protein
MDLLIGLVFILALMFLRMFQLVAKDEIDGLVVTAEDFAV